MNNIFRKRNLIFCFLLFLVAISAIEARGKLKGKVIGKSSGEPLIGVNVMIVGTQWGAATDIDGNFSIIGIRPGTYSVKASYIGYRSVTIQQVVIRTGLTAELNFELDEDGVQTEEVVVVAEQKLVQRDLTSTRKTVTRESMGHIPGFESSDDIFRLQGGITMAAPPQNMQMADGTQLQVRDESVKDVHVRGGRGGEILFMVDGVPVNHPVYGGRSVLDLNIVAVEQVELLTGAFSARYGQAQSGVINITTRSGGEKFKGGAEYKTDKLGFLGDDRNTQYGSVFLSGPEPITNYLLPALGINTKGKMNFFLSANSTLTDTEHNNNRTRKEFEMFGFKLTEQQDNKANINAKLNWSVTDRIRATFGFNGSWKQWSGFDWNWLFHPDNKVTDKRNNVNFNFLLNHVLSEKTYYSISMGYLGIDYTRSLDGKTPADFWVFKDGKIESTVREPYKNSLTYFNAGDGYETYWRDDKTSSFTLNADFTSQITDDHLFEVGFEAQYHDISYVDIQDGGLKLSEYGKSKYLGDGTAVAPPGPFKEFGQNRWVFHSYPLVGGVYIQDKFEKEFIIINAGVRAEWCYLGKKVDEGSWKSQWEKATGLKANWNSFKYRIAPRFGISFPIQEETVLFFSYGHFYQLPEMQYFYRDPFSGGLTGNPDLDYELTITYEFGVTHQLSDDLVIDVKSYAKDISEQVGQTTLQSASGTPVTIWDNKSYGRARGLEFELNKDFSNNYSFKLTYTLQWANGYAASAFDDYVRSQNDFPYPIRERRMNWDVRHEIIFQGTLASPKGQPFNLFGLELPDDWGLTVLSNFNSGYAYTPGTNDPAERQKLENVATGPVGLNTDIKFYKGFSIGDINLKVTLDVFNVFDVRNVNLYYGFNPWTGQPFKYGDLVDDTHKYHNWYSAFYKRDPRQYMSGRYAKLGIKLDF